LAAARSGPGSLKALAHKALTRIREYDGNGKPLSQKSSAKTAPWDKAGSAERSSKIDDRDRPLPRARSSLSASSLAGEAAECVPDANARSNRTGAGKFMPWGAADYRALFDERAAIAEFDGGSTRLEAEARALQFVIVEWLNRHPASSPAGQCAWCGRAEASGSAIVPFGTGDHHSWLHAQCWPAWHRRRQADAHAELRAFGLPVIASGSWTGS
jgi:hypothetical protein